MPIILSKKAGGGGSPSGAAGGSLTGTYPNPTVANDAIVPAMMAAGRELDYAQAVADITVSDTSSPGDLIVSLPARVYDGSTTVIIEFFAVVDTGAAASAEVFFELFDSGSNVIRIADVIGVLANALRFTVHAAYRITPTAASHTYLIRAVRVNANGVVRCTSSFPPAFIRATEVIPA